MNSKADRFKNLEDDNMLSELLGVEPEETTEEQETANELIKIVNEFQALDHVDDTAIDAFLNQVKSLIANDTDDRLTPSTEEQILAEGGNARTNKKESKTKRTNLLFRPSAYEDFQKLAIIRHTSTNDLMNTIVENVVDANADVLEAYDKLNNLAK